MLWSDVLVWFGLSDWDGQVGFVRSEQICMVELRWIGRFLVKMVGSGSAGQVRFSRLDWVR